MERLLDVNMPQCANQSAKQVNDVGGANDRLLGGVDHHCGGARRALGVKRVQRDDAAVCINERDNETVDADKDCKKPMPRVCRAQIHRPY